MSLRQPSSNSETYAWPSRYFVNTPAQKLNRPATTAQTTPTIIAVRVWLLSPRCSFRQSQTILIV
jgi:hypothetical protein